MTLSTTSEAGKTVSEVRLLNMENMPRLNSDVMIFCVETVTL